MSTAKDRLYEVYEAYRLALSTRAKDLKEATTSIQVTSILANLDKLQTLYFQAVVKELSATGPDVESAYVAAKEANSMIRKATQAAKEVAERIRDIGELVKAITSLVKTASS